MVMCQIAQNILICTSNNRILFQFCNVNDGIALDCRGAFDISAFNLPTGDYNISVFFTDVFMQNVDFSLPVFYRSPGRCDEYSVYKEKKKKEQKRVFIFVTVQVLVISMESFMKMELPSQLPTDATHGTQHYNA